MVQNICSVYQEPIRLDRFLRLVFGQHLSQSVIEKQCRTKKIKINHKPVKPKTRVYFKDELSLHDTIQDKIDSGFVRPQHDTQLKNDLKDMIVYDAIDFCIIYKPYGLPSQGGPNIQTSVAQLAGRDYWIVHRLDRHTEGLMLLAKNRHTAAQLMELFRTRQVQKHYCAIVRGYPRPTSGLVEAPLENICEEGKDRMVVSQYGQSAVTRYRVVRKLNNQHSIVLLKPMTGRKHQLRVHMQYLGTPILGDMKYGKRGKRMHLYAYKIEFVWQGKKISICAADFLLRVKN